jgi:hypothetical protein
MRVGLFLLALAAALLDSLGGIAAQGQENGVAIPVAATLPGGCPQCQCPHEEIVFQNVICHRCVLVPDVKQIKKTVYDCKEVPFCLPKVPHIFSHFKKPGCCDSGPCVECDCPRYKKVLLKKEVVCKEIYGHKCVVEEYVQRVPCRVCRQCANCCQAVPTCEMPLPPPPVVTGPITGAPPAPAETAPLPLPPVPPPDA